MDHINSIRAALRAKAPVVAVPVEGHAPICVRAKLLKGASEKDADPVSMSA
jgi:hypothetical protein